MGPEEAFKALFSKRAKGFDDRQVDEVLRALEGATAWAALFVLEAMRLAPSAGRLEVWRDALEILQRLERLDAALETGKPWILGALQAATVADPPTVAVLVALAKEGSDASCDALIADFERCRTAEGGILLEERARTLARYGKGIPLCERYAGWVREALAGSPGAAGSKAPRGRPRTASAPRRAKR